MKLVMVVCLIQLAAGPGAVPFRESWKEASFSHDLSGVEYRVSGGAKGYLLEFARPGTDVKGQRLLEWFVGSGGLGRSYLFSLDGFLYQAPVSYYSSANKWRVSPGYESKRNIDLTRAVETACLQCHAPAACVRWPGLRTGSPRRPSKRAE